MNIEEWVITALLIGYMVFITIQARSVQLYAYKSIINRSLRLILATTLPLLFWNVLSSQKYIIMMISILIVYTAVSREGLTNNKIIKFGILGGEYRTFDAVKLTKVNEKTTELSFKSINKKNDVRIFVRGTLNECLIFLQNKVDNIILE